MSQSTPIASDLGLVQDLLHDQAQEIQRLQSELEGKEQLVHAITERLEETVEQLDRLQRQGNSRSPAAAGAGAGLKEILDSQNVLADRVGQSLEYWEGTAGYFEQILERLDELSKSGVSSSGRDSGSGSSAYEKMKANLLAQSAPALPPPPTPSATVPAIPPLLLAATAAAQASSPPPVPISPEIATHEELVEAVQVRDAYIVSLVQELRKRDDTLFQNVDWSKLSSAPEDLRPQLIALSQRLRETIQREEFDHSMERARLAREEARIDLVKQQLEAQIRRLSAAPGTTTSETTPQKQTGKDGWLGRLKRNP